MLSFTWTWTTNLFWVAILYKYNNFIIDCFGNNTFKNVLNFRFKNFKLIKTLKWSQYRKLHFRNFSVSLSEYKILNPKITKPLVLLLFIHFHFNYNWRKTKIILFRRSYIPLWYKISHIKCIYFLQCGQVQAGLVGQATLIHFILEIHIPGGMWASMKKWWSKNVQLLPFILFVHLVLSKRKLILDKTSWTHGMLSLEKIWTITRILSPCIKFEYQYCFILLIQNIKNYSNPKKRLDNVKSIAKITRNKTEN